ncbi:MAG: aryl-alcohol dehydrogenase [FCB group bacterium]|nr:aryl-alcohol dehydrogenase [FCB group bacterium]
MHETESKLSKLGLGTVQFGLDYGVSNPGGRTKTESVRRILQTALATGIKTIDTATLYGQSEKVLGGTLPTGHDFQITTKTGQFNTPLISPKHVNDLMTTFACSLEKMALDRVYGLLIHDANDLLAKGGEYLYEALQKLKEKRLVEKIGVSVYSGKQIDTLLKNYSLDLIQLPLNVFDQRLIQGGQIDRLHQAGVEIHARSIFLQGLLLIDPDHLPGYFRPVKNHLINFRKLSSQTGQTPLQTSLDFALGLEAVDRIIVGVCNLKQLEEIIQSIENMPPGLADFAPLALNDSAILNPSEWKVDEHEPATA